MELSRRNLIVGSAAVLAMSAVPVVATEIVERKISPDLIVPDVMKLSISRDEYRFANYEMNTWTYVYDWMERWFLDENGKIISIQSVHRIRDKEIYDRWVYETGRWNIPPHIVFGGAIVAGEGDFLFYQKWEDHTKMLLRTGQLS
ncbi:hypothetical protein EVB97_080 [Rhizobium phage RHph_Y65]|uniref:Uncharacterized protein n=1 Tax=Rhizobium phage RHph_Y65 TaxID=2509785 RepID=A0A7S5UYS3_9CAUD|nr:hypothetical protein PQC17_gp080 [Rhizobium phage RHph_Y65]QIG72638.1 hypothetical protein EVB97_080 [Rhizobium phage RHph_Y65]